MVIHIDCVAWCDLRITMLATHTPLTQIQYGCLRVTWIQCANAYNVIWTNWRCYQFPYIPVGKLLLSLLAGYVALVTQFPTHTCKHQLVRIQGWTTNVHDSQIPMHNQNVCDFIDFEWFDTQCITTIPVRKKAISLRSFSFTHITQPLSGGFFRSVFWCEYFRSEINFPSVHRRLFTFYFL